MCDRYGCATLPNSTLASLKTLDFSRRNFLQATGATALTMAIGPGLLGPALAADSTLKSTHGNGFCNLNLFLSHALQTAKEDEEALSSYASHVRSALSGKDCRVAQMLIP